jgi:energy-coupling factor transporter ATP-binding protein EcfA2
MDHTVSSKKMSSPAKENGAIGVCIKSVRVRKLFGYFNYDIPNKSSGSNFDRLLILYGENGAGKTNLLKLVFHLLSTRNDRGHRNFLLQNKFGSVEVELSNGMHVGATRRAPEVTGPYRLYIKRGRRSLIDFNFTEPSYEPHSSKFNQLQKYLEILSSFPLSLYFLSDNRNLISDAWDISPERKPGGFSEELQQITVAELMARTKAVEKKDEVDESVDRFIGYVVRRTLEGASTGEANTHVLYEQLITGLASQARDEKQKAPIPSLLGELAMLTERSVKFAGFGLMKPLSVSKIAKAFRNAPDARRAVMANILIPYIEGVRARLDALQELYDMITAFVGALNALYKNKSVEFSINAGMVIVARDGTIIPPKFLSSGERQLLLLLCNVILARYTSSVFIIDEPELSLNIKWQRRLIGLLLDCTNGGKVQFVVATHSIELLTTHQENVVDLVEI